MNEEATGNACYLGLLSRRRLLKGATAGGFALGVAAIIGCGDDDDDDDAATPAATATGTAEPGGTATPTATPTPGAAASKRGGFLAYMMPPGYQGPNIDPYRTDTSSGMTVVLGNMLYEGLINPDFTNREWRSPYSIVPWLAESWEQPPDLLTYVVNVREGVKFHNGETLTADDVSFTWDYATAEDAINNQFKTSRGELEVVDAQAFRLIAPAPNAEFIEVINSYFGSGQIMPRSAADAGVDFSKEAVGTGPFRAPGGWSADSLTTLVRFDDYWGGGEPHREGTPFLDGLRHTPVDKETQAAAFIAGQLDVFTAGDRVQADPILNAVPEAEASTYATDFWYGLGFNQHREPFNDIRVRRAIHLAIDRQDINALATFGDGQISGPMITARDGFSLPLEELLKLPGYRPDKEADRAEAVKLLDAAGVGGGFDTEFQYWTILGSSLVFSEATQPQLADVLGIDASLVPMDTPTWQATRNGPSPSGDLTMYIHVMGGTARPGTTVAQYHSSDARAQAVGFNDPEVDRLIDAAKLEFDVEARGELYQQLELALLDVVNTAAISAPAWIAMQQPWIHDWRDIRAARHAITNPSWIWMDLDEAPSDRRA